MIALPELLPELLHPVSDAHPAGEDIEGTPLWMEIREARRADEPGSRGIWNRDLKTSDWGLTARLSKTALSQNSKDLRLAIWLLEANINLDGFRGLALGLQLLAGLLDQFWDRGLYPEEEVRSQALRWLENPDKLALTLRLAPLTSRTTSERDFHLADWEQSIAIGSEKDIYDQFGNLDERKQERREAALRQGGVSREMIEAAARDTPAASFAIVHEGIEASTAAAANLEAILDAKFGEEAPSLHALKDVLQSARNVVERMNGGPPVKALPPEGETATNVPEPAVDRSGGGGGPLRPISSISTEHVETGASASWQEAERLVMSGQIQQGISEMTRLAASEHGRNRFLRRLRLGEICFECSKTRLGTAILEDLARQVDDRKLDAWESPELIGRVWGRLGRQYLLADNVDSATQYFSRLCALDPWQAFLWDQRP